MGLDELTDVFGSEMVDYFFMEYFMGLIAKSKLLDKISDAVNDGADMEMVKGVLHGTDGGDSDETGIIV